MFSRLNLSLKQIKRLLSLVTCHCLLGFVAMSPNVLLEFCEDETFEGDCGSDSVIMVEQARYGRMRIGTCLTTNYGNLGCSTDMVQVLDKDCSGRHNCKVNTRDLIVAGMKPCPKDLRNYLEARYKCVPVHTKDANGDCCTRSKEAILTAKSGHIASIITQESACGSIDCPWVIQAKPGQKIRLDLYDFNTYYSDSGQSVNKLGVDFSHTCHVYVIIKEERNSMTACAEGIRQRHIYTTDSNRVEIRVVTKRKSTAETQFLLNYTVSGCPDPPTPKGGWMERREDYVLVGCSSAENKATAKLTCKDKRWIGDTPDCTSEDDSMSVAGFLDGILSLTPDMSIIVICLIALTISLIILCIGIFCIRRKWYNTTTAKHSHYDLPGNIEGQVISNPTGDQHFIARLEHKSSTAEYGSDPYGIQKNVLPSHSVGRAHTSTTNQQQDIVVVPDGYRDISNYGKRPHYVEHIYESPTFARKEYSRETSESSTKYYELEADMEPLAHLSCDTNNKGICHYPRLNKPVLPSRVTPPQSTDINTHTNSHLSY